MKSQLPEGFSLRSAAPEDARAVADLICLCDIADYGEPDYSTEDVRSDWRRDGFDLARDTWLVYAAEGTLVGYGNVSDNGDVVSTEQSCVHPAYRGRGLEEFLIGQAQRYARKLPTQIESNGL